jgi:hypothetical protein
MIKATGHGPDGPVLFLGLSSQNVARLFADQPIVVDAEPLGLPPMKIVILAGVTEEVIAKTLSDHVRVTHREEPQAQATVSMRWDDEQGHWCIAADVPPR